VAPSLSLRGAKTSSAAERENEGQALSEQQNRGRLYGRHKGRPLSARRVMLLAEAYPQLAIDLARPAPPSLGDIFPHQPARVTLEIGFGGGEHLLAVAACNREVGFIGIEPFVNGMAKAVAGIVEGALSNVRLFDGDAAHLLDWLPARSLAAVDLLYPDPWPKKRHWKRRVVSAENLDRLARVLQPGGVLQVVSDIPSYAEWTLAQLARRRDFVWMAEQVDDWRLPFADWITTRYEQKAKRAGRIPTYLQFRRQ
jgi:tRNA (guanine-N7-)-methyltransferase